HHLGLSARAVPASGGRPGVGGDGGVGPPAGGPRPRALPRVARPAPHAAGAPAHQRRAEPRRPAPPDDRAPPPVLRGERQAAERGRGGLRGRPAGADPRERRVRRLAAVLAGPLAALALGCSRANGVPERGTAGAASASKAPAAAAPRVVLPSGASISL